MDTDLTNLLAPRAAKDKYHFIKFLGRGEDGWVLLALERGKRHILNNCVAVKIIKPEKRGHLETVVPKLKVAQQEGGDRCPVALVHDIEDYGLPPFLVFHLFTEVLKAQQYLQSIGEIYHGDLGAGGNVMLSHSERLPLVKPIGSAGIRTWNERTAIKHVYDLTRLAITKLNNVPQRWHSSAFSNADLEIINQFYSAMNGVRDNWIGLQEKWAGRLNEHKEKMWHADAYKIVDEQLEQGALTEDELKKILAGNGLQFEVEPADTWK
ncbi:hypothetical protein CC86DRAFT_408265 [Ophiobolus disseminans]|uniref:Protein kinase domain-containing protein n=1 Tax=Ophiobolus disseminans TaxID=1469910 RepID=A0A6A6ZU77_9PLEO|nr:hypothetical protein CC86DRAFT_408265 [Ophiobolus disseminans]